MTRTRKPIDPETSIAMREAFYEAVDSGGLTIAEGVKRMREIVNMTQPEFAYWLKIAPRALMDIERGVGNPRLSTLLKIAKPFNLKIGFIHKPKA
ncbi:helix-turn-helix transcriptional regulator [Thiofilum flexile]|uniref:helix-turn-helix transcriptional regulator n=1 Tax=Thiofilum flexile TaxID=125627 RepID=UPI0003777CA6|nr:helix-turn-helix transcriptional regulator [Thiofilum flexile]